MIRVNDLGGNYPGLSSGANVIATVLKVLKVESLSGPLWAEGGVRL